MATTPILLAQVSTTEAAAGARPQQIVKVYKPQGDQALVVHLGYEQNYKLDLSAIANEKITLVHVGEKLIILFDNKSTVTVEPFFDSMDAPLPNVQVEATGRDFTSSEFAAAFPITADQSVLTAAGDSGPGSPSSGANFSGSTVDPLSVPNPLDLLGQEELGPVPFSRLPQGTVGTGATVSPAADSASGSGSGSTPPTTTDDNPNAPPLTPPDLSPASGLTHDETAGLQTAADPNPASDVAGAAPPPAILALFNAIGAARGNDADVAVKDNGAIGFAASPADLVTLSGGSASPASVQYALTATDGTFSGVSTTDGTQIFLYEGTGATAGLILGRVGHENGATDTADPNGTVAFALAVDPATGQGYIAQYLSLHNPVADSTAAALDDPVSLLASAVQVQVTYGDGIGNFATSTPLAIGDEFGFQDDGPVAGAVSKNAAGQGHDTNLLLTLDISGSMNDPSGLTGLTRLDVLKAAVNELFEQYGAIGNVRVQIVAFNSAAGQIGTDWMTIAQAKAAVNLLTDSANTNYDIGVSTAESIFTHPGALPTPGVVNAAYFMSDGIPNEPVSSVGINAAEEAAWIDFLTTNHINSFALGIGTGVTQSALDPLAYDGQSNSNTDAIVVTDSSQLASTLGATVGNTNGNLLSDGAIQGSLGADGGYVKSIAVEGTTYTYDPATHAMSVSGADHGAFDASTHVESVTLASGGVLALDMDGGSFTFSAPTNGSNGGSTTVIPFVLADNDGDTASSTLSITLSNQDHHPIVRDDHVVANVTGGSGTSIAIPDYALLFNDSDIDGQTVSIAAVGNLVSGNSVTHAAGSVTFVDNNATGGSFTYTGTTNAPAASDTGDVTVDRSQSGTTLTGTGLGEILLGRDGANNIINANEGNDVLLGGTGTDTLSGGAGNDLLAGNAGGDTLTGGAGSDHFRFNAPTDGMDHIADFSGAGGQGDSIDIAGAAFGGLAAGALPAGLFAANAGGNFSDPAQRFAFDTASRTLYYDADGSGAGVKVALAHLENAASITAADIRIV